MVTDPHTSFLPNTVSFTDAVPDEPTSLHEPQPSGEPSAHHSRKTSSLSLPVRAASSTSLFDSRIILDTPPGTAAAEYLAAFPSAVEAHKRYFATLTDPGSLVLNDAAVPKRGGTTVQLYNQPRSRAGLMPSSSVLDFARVNEQLRHEKSQQQVGRKRDVTRSSPHATSRNVRVEKGFQNWTVEPALRGSAGLFDAMRSVAQCAGVDVSWVGTLGFPTDALPAATKERINDQVINECHSDIVYVSDKDLAGHYTHYCKVILWPIFHYQIPDHPKSKAYADHSWEFYRNVNQAFADKVVESYKRHDTIWIHDYHLLLVPGMVRKKLPDAQIGFFLHTAFPSSEVFRCLPTRTALLEGMLGANLVAFQIEEYAQHFLQTCSRLLTVETTSDGVQLEDRFVNVTSQAIGISPSVMAEARDADEVHKWIEQIQSQDRYKGKFLIVAHDKLDNVHGVRQKLLAYELFLNKYPEWRDKTVLIQVATSTSEQTDLLTTVSDICVRIDNAHSTLVHQPLVFLMQDIEFSQYLALLTVADVLMISSLRDGMNLTAHEYVLCQDGQHANKKHGPLILSEFTGSASVFDQGHISINPWDYNNQAEAIKTALEMDPVEKERRWSHLHNMVLTQNGRHWSGALGRTLEKVYQQQHERSSTVVPRLSPSKLSEKYRGAERRVFFIDYEGTLAPHKTTSGIPLTSPHRIVETLSDLMADAKNVVYIMSGRGPGEMESVFRTATGLGLIAENGCFVRPYGSSKPHGWRCTIDLGEVRDWKDEVKSILTYYHERMHGSEMEERYCSLLFRYDAVEDQQAATRLAGDCADQINGSCKSRRIHAVPISKALLIEQIDYNKATSARRIFEQCGAQAVEDGAPQPDFLLVAGDDREDEVVFRWGNDLAARAVVRDVFTVSVGRRNTEARATLNQGSMGLLGVLQKLARISSDEAAVHVASHSA